MKNNFTSLENKTVAITGSTGGLGRELCRYLATLGANLILVDRNPALSSQHAEDIRELNNKISVECITADLEDMVSVKAATEKLTEKKIDVFIHNAGAYSIPRRVLPTGYDNVFQINFVSPYYMIRRLLPILSERRGRAVVVGSIAHNYSKTDPEDIDFKSKKAASKVYGNAKRYLMFSLYSLCRENGVKLAVTHPGITFTNITAHYPKLVFAIIKHPMKLIFMKKDKAALSILSGVYTETEKYYWLGPRFFGIWGTPKKSRLKTASEEEISFIEKTADEIYGKI